MERWWSGTYQTTSTSKAAYSARLTSRVKSCVQSFDLVSVLILGSRLIFRSVSILRRGTQSGFLEQAPQTLITQRHVYQEQCACAYAPSADNTQPLKIAPSHQTESLIPSSKVQGFDHERTGQQALCDVLTWASDWDTAFLLFEVRSTTCGTRVLHLISHIFDRLSVRRGQRKVALVCFCLGVHLMMCCLLAFQTASYMLSQTKQVRSPALVSVSFAVKSLRCGLETYNTAQSGLARGKSRIAV